MNNAPTELATKLAKAPAGEAVPVDLPTTVGRRLLGRWLTLAVALPDLGVFIQAGLTPEQGTSFRITLPIDQPPEAENSGESNS
jgi:hypothetical protein